MNEQAVFFIILIVSFIIVHNVFNFTNLINPFVLFFLYQTIFFYIALFYIQHYEKNGIYISPPVQIFVAYAYFASVVGAILSILLFRRYDNFQKMMNEISIINDNRSIELHSAYILFFFGIIFYVLYYLKSGFHPLTTDDFENDRILAKKGAGIISILAITFSSYSALFICYHKKTLFIFKLFVILATIFVLIGFGSRAPVLKFIFCLLILFLINNKIKLRLYHLMIFGFGLFCLMVLLGSLRQGFDIDLIKYFEARFAWRPFVSIYNFERIYNYFSPDGTLYGGSLWIELKTLLPGYQPNFGTWVKEALGLSFSGGSVTSSYLGVAYINFGILGIILTPIIFGFLLQSLYLYLMNKTHVSLNLMILFLEISISLWGISTVGATTPILYFVMPYVFVYKIHKFFHRSLLITFGKNNKCYQNF